MICMSMYAQNIPDGSSLSGIPTHVEVAPTDFDQSPNTEPDKFNFYRVYTPFEAMTSVPDYANIGSSTNLHVATSYTDGWDRPLMTTSRTLPGIYAVQPFDNRAKKTSIEYLPYLATNSDGKFRDAAYSEQASFYSYNFPAEGETGYTRSKNYSNAGVPTTLVCSPGKEFTGETRGVIVEKHVSGCGHLNSSPLNVLYNLEYSSNQICKNGNYSTGEYIVRWTKGEHNKEVLEYLDKAGRLLCKRERVSSGNYNSTYYVYDDMGRLTHIIPPRQAAALATNNCISNVIPATSTPAQVYAYEYNEFGQKVNTQIPGKEGLIKVVFDKYHRPFLQQTPALADNGKAIFTLYDKLGRILITGIFDEGHNMDQAYYNSLIDGSTSLPTYYDAQSQPINSENTLEYWLLNDMPVNEYPQDQGNEPFLAGCEIHTLNYYDNYDIDPANQVSYSTAYNSQFLTGAGTVAPEQYGFVHGKLVASKIRILDNNITNNFTNTPWITNVFFYDDNGRIIQTHTLNPWNTTNWDVVCKQYNFSGDNILTIFDHYGPQNGDKPHTVVRKKYNYSLKNGRLENTLQQIDNGAWMTIATYTYDHLNHLTKKRLGNVESQNYTYNIRQQLTGINPVVINASTNTMSAVEASYASILNYETGYVDQRYDGKLTGYQWRTLGSADAMSYGYAYDDLGRMKSAEYRYLDPGTNPATSANWIKTARDYTVSNLNYDANGNITSMNQRGDDNNASPQPDDIDILSYTYDNANRLQKVEDAGVASAGYIHDFDNQNSGTNDYSYDVNGNLTEDKNRGITEITYNHQDLPQTIIKGLNGEILNIYSADGTLIQRSVDDYTNVNTYHYWGPFVYKNEDLEMVMHDEGRARYDAANDEFDYDFFIRDHLGNVRTIVKADVTYGSLDYTATFEMVAATVEESTFDQIGEVRDLSPSGTPGDLMSGILDGSIDSQRVGAALLVHAMAGEEFNLKGYGYYEEENSQYYSMYPYEEDMMNSLLSALTAGAAEGGEGGSSPTQIINNVVNSSNYSAYESLKQAATNSNYPRVYLNYLVFDEYFELQEDYSQVVQINGGPNSWRLMEIPGKQTMPMNGYLLVYFSNESQMEAAIDNIHLIHYEGVLLEEQHYYPHGLVIESGGQGTVSPLNKYLFQGNKLDEDLDLYINNFNFRQYDAQIGRFMSVDPLADNGQESLSPFHFCYNDPANMIDPLGLKTGAAYLYEDLFGNLWGALHNVDIIGHRSGSASYSSHGYITLGSYEDGGGTNAEYEGKQGGSGGGNSYTRSKYVTNNAEGKGHPVSGHHSPTAKVLTPAQQEAQKKNNEATAEKNRKDRIADSRQLEKISPRVPRYNPAYYPSQVNTVGISVSVDFTPITGGALSLNIGFVEGHFGLWYSFGPSLGWGGNVSANFFAAFPNGPQSNAGPEGYIKGTGAQFSTNIYGGVGGGVSQSYGANSYTTYSIGVGVGEGASVAPYVYGNGIFW